MKYLTLVSLLLVQVFASNNLNVKFEWKQIDFAFPTENGRKYALDHKDFIPENNLPLGLEVFENKLFITLPRWKSGVAASLTYVDITDSNRSPKLIPYPNWPAHNLKVNSTPEIVSPFRVKADQCNRLWVLDTGIEDLLGDTKILAPSRISVYDLKNDTLIRQFVIPKDQLKEDSFLGNIVVEVVNCEDTFAYVGDLGKGALIVYSWKNNTSWKITHNFFNIDPLMGHFNVSGTVFEWTDALFGLSLTAPNEKGFSTLYFHPLVSQNEFSVSTEFLRDPEVARNSYHNFTILGSRGPSGQSTASAYHPKSNVLFYGLPNLNAVDCWKTTEQYNPQTQGRVYQDNVTMIFPNDLKVDTNDNLWVLSDRLPRFMYHELDFQDVNFRVFTASVADAVKGTVCESQSNLDIKDRFQPSVNEERLNTTTPKENSSGATIHISSLVFLIAILSTRA